LIFSFYLEMYSLCYFHFCSFNSYCSSFSLSSSNFIYWNLFITPLEGGDNNPDCDTNSIERSSFFVLSYDR
jgi:hypothetical protein